MNLDRVETGGEDRPNEVVVFLENRARAAVALGSLSLRALRLSSRHPLPAVVSHLVVDLPRGSYLVHLRPQSRQPRQLRQPRCGHSRNPSSSSTVRPPWNALNCLMSYLLGVRRRAAVVVRDASRGFICGRLPYKETVGGRDVSLTPARQADSSRYLLHTFQVDL